MASVRFPRMSFPSEEDVDVCNDWCEPLHLVARAIVHHREAAYFDVADFMVMGKLHRRGRPDLILYKHCDTRRYLNLDAGGHAYRYLPPPTGSESLGQYRQHRDLTAAIDELRLAELPCLLRSRFERQCAVDQPGRRA